MNEQEQFWLGQQGTAYIDRNIGVDINARVAFWNRAIAWDEPGAPQSVIELGANIGLNLQAIRSIHTALDMAPPDMFAVEINETACAHLKAAQIPHRNMSLLDVLEHPAGVDNPADLAFTMGVLIHVAPGDLAGAYAALNICSRRYVLMAEYYCPSPREIYYRGEAERCWARDFAGEFLDMFPAYRLVDYGFVYRRDPVAPLDDISWFLMEKA